MIRREFITLLGGAAAWPLGARAQQPGKTYRIGWLQPVSIPDAWLKAFRQGLQELNYVEGKNLIIEYRWGDGNFDRLPAMAAELVQLKVDVLISGNTAALLVLQKATRTIPIVMVGSGDPVAAGLAASLARPQGNITGLSLNTSLSSESPELEGKRLGILKELMPRLARVTVLSNPRNPPIVMALRANQAAAQTLGLELESVEMQEPSDLDRALSRIVEGRPDVVVVLGDTMILSQRSQIAAFAVKQRLPSISTFEEFAEAGGLMSYGPSLPDIYRRAAGYINRILRGANPAELPIEQPNKFDLVINLKTARALGIEAPATLLARANEVIE